MGRRRKVSKRRETKQAYGCEKRKQREHLLMKSDEAAGLVVMLLFQAAQLPGTRQGGLQT